MPPRSLAVRCRLGALGADAPSRLEALRHVCTSLDRSAAEGFWLAPDAGDRGLEPLVVLGACAAASERIRLAEAPSTTSRRPPSLTAKYVSSLDVVSNGRALCLLGWSGEPLERLGEALEVVRALLRTPAPSLAGVHYRLSGAHNVPAAAATAVRLGLFVDDEAVHADHLDGLVELAARSCDLLVVGEAAADAGVLEVPARRTRLHRAGRLLDELEVRLCVPAGAYRPAELLERLAHLGADGLVLDAGAHLDPSALVGELEELADR